MVVIDFWILKRLLSLHQSLEKTHWRNLIQFNRYADFHLDQLELLKVVKICCNLWQLKLLNRYLAGSGIVDISEHCDEEYVKWSIQILVASNICTEFTEIGGSGYENKNQAINGWWAWQLLLLIINPKIICCKKGRMKEYSALFKKNRCLSRSAADIVSLVARRSAIIHWHDEVCGVACRLACSLTCEAAHVSGGVWHNLTQAIYFPREIPFQSVSMKRWFLVN